MNEHELQSTSIEQALQILLNWNIYLAKYFQQWINKQSRTHGTFIHAHTLMAEAAMQGTNLLLLMRGNRALSIQKASLRPSNTLTHTVGTTIPTNLGFGVLPMSLQHTAKATTKQ